MNALKNVINKSLVIKQFNKRLNEPTKNELRKKGRNMLPIAHASFLFSSVHRSIIFAEFLVKLKSNLDSKTTQITSAKCYTRSKVCNTKTTVRDYTSTIKSLNNILCIIYHKNTKNKYH